MRWNVSEREWDDADKESGKVLCKGMPVSRGYPVWFVLPDDAFKNTDVWKKIIVSMKPDNAATYERAKRLANIALWTIDLQRRRLNSKEPEDAEFIFRQWSDFHFLVVALTRLRRAAELASKVTTISEQIQVSLKTFDDALPNLKKMRDVAEHINDYAMDNGKDKNISRKSLEVSTSDGGDVWEWLGYELDAGAALRASAALYKALIDCQPLVDKTPPEMSQTSL